MARVLFKETWFSSVRSSSWNEVDFENLILTKAESLFPGWIPVKFKADVVGDESVVKRPDLALIDPKYRKWCVVEVELAHHDLHTHVLPQIEVFCSGLYGEVHARYLKAQESRLDLEKLMQMMSGSMPDVLVLVDRPDTNWRKALKQVGALLGIVEPFRGPNDELLLRLNGDQLDLPGATLSRCSRYLRRFWKVHSPASLPVPARADGLLEIVVEGVPVLWSRVNLADAVMLTAVEPGDPLVGTRLADVLADDDGRLRFVRVAKED